MRETHMEQVPVSITEYITILQSPDVDKETKDLAMEALKSTLRAVPDLMKVAAKLLESLN